MTKLRVSEEWRKITPLRQTIKIEADGSTRYIIQPTVTPERRYQLLKEAVEAGLPRSRSVGHLRRARKQILVPE